MAESLNHAQKGQIKKVGEPHESITPKFNDNSMFLDRPHFTDPKNNENKDRNALPEPNMKNADQISVKPKSFAEAIKSGSQNTNTNIPQNQNKSITQIKEEIHQRIFHTIAFTPDQSPSGIEKKVCELTMAICHEIGQGAITSIQYKGRGQYAVELKTKELVQKIATKGLQLPGAIQRAPVKPRRNTVLLITIKTDASVLNEEIEDALRPFGKIVNINYGYYNNNKTIRDGRRLIHIIPTVDIDKIPHTVNIDNRVHILYFRGKTTKPTRQNTQATQELLADLDISDSEEMSQDEDEDEVEDEAETERTDNTTIKDDTKTTNPPGDETKAEKPTEAKQTIKPLPQAKPRPKSDTNTKQTPQVQNNLQTQHSAPPSAEAQLTLLVPAVTETGTDTKMDTEQTETEPNKTNNPQKNVKRKSVTTPTKETKLNPIKTKRKPNRTET